MRHAEVVIRVRIDLTIFDQLYPAFFTDPEKNIDLYELLQYCPFSLKNISAYIPIQKIAVIEEH